MASPAGSGRAGRGRARREPRWVVHGSRALLAVAAATAAVFLVSFFGVNAQILGGRDAGVALALALAMPLAVYVSLALALVGMGALLAAALAGLPLGRHLWALGVTLLPVVTLLLADLRAALGHAP